jgi:hypothetical protein
MQHRKYVKSRIFILINAYEKLPYVFLSMIQ